MGKIETADLEDLNGQEISVSDDPLDDARIESNKSIGDVFAPASGTVSEINAELNDEPGMLNEDPYGKGWLFKMTPSNWAAEKANLMDVKKYAEFLKTL